jgi:hypothetical protein
MRLIFAVLLTAFAADQAFAQAVVPAAVAATDWSALITTTLNQLLVASGVGAGTTLVGVLFQVVKVLLACRAKLEAATSTESTTATAGLIDQTVHEGIAMIAGRLQVKGKSLTQAFRSADVDRAVQFAREALQAHGLSLDSDVIRGKIHAVLGQLALGQAPAAGPQPGPKPPTPPKAAAAAVMTGAN